MAVSVQLKDTQQQPAFTYKLFVQAAINVYRKSGIIDLRRWKLLCFQFANLSFPAAEQTLV